jgi:hypothetical protein
MTSLTGPSAAAGMQQVQHHRLATGVQAQWERRHHELLTPEPNGPAVIRPGGEHRAGPLTFHVRASVELITSLPGDRDLAAERLAQPPGTSRQPLAISVPIGNPCRTMGTQPIWK